MVENLNKHLIDVGVDGLVVGGYDKHSCGVTVAKGQGLLLRGSILAVGDDNKAILLGSNSASAGKQSKTESQNNADDTTETTTTTTATYEARYILEKDVDATDEDVVAICYDRVTVVKDKTIVAENYTLTAKDIDALRVHNIFFEDEV